MIFSVFCDLAGKLMGLIIELKKDLWLSKINYQGDTDDKKDKQGQE